MDVDGRSRVVGGPLPPGPLIWLTPKSRQSPAPTSFFLRASRIVRCVQPKEGAQSARLESLRLNFSDGIND